MPKPQLVRVYTTLVLLQGALNMSYYNQRKQLPPLWRALRVTVGAMHGPGLQVSTCMELLIMHAV